MKRLLLLLVLALTLGGCSNQIWKEASDRYWAPVAGSEIQLTRVLEIPGGETRVFLQRGQVIARSDLDYYHPSCDLEVFELKQHARTVEKDIFIVGRLTSGRESVVELGVPLKFASRLGFRPFGYDAPSVHKYVRVKLHSERQPDVMRLTCRGALEDFYAADFPSKNEIRLALGEVLIVL